MKISKRDHKLLVDILNELSSKKGISTNLNIEINKWTNFIKQIEHGYENTIYDYINDLCSRDIIEEILRKSSNTLNNSIKKIIDPWDKRFINATVKIKNSLLRHKVLISYYWWFRIPKKLIRDLKEDIESELL